MTEIKIDLISREWLKDAFDNLCCHACKTCRNFRNEDSFYKCNLIEDAPTVEERPHGEWKPYTTIDGYTKHATCTNCGYERKVGIGCSLDENNLPNFCEKCGADMRKKKEERR